MVDEVTKLGAGVYVYTNLQRCTVTLRGPVYTGGVGYQRVTYYGQNMSWISDLLTHQIVDLEGRLQIAYIHSCFTGIIKLWVGGLCVCVWRPVSSPPVPIPNFEAANDVGGGHINWQLPLG